MFNVNTREMHRLANMLGGANIPYEIRELWGGLQIVYPNGDDFVCSVVQDAFSYGGPNGYLEIMGLLTEEEGESDSVKGWLTAEDVFERISKHFAENT
jgi:hypothetical protein